MKNYLKRTTTFFLALLMLLSVPLQAFAEVTQGADPPKEEKKINYDKTPIRKGDYVNKVDKLPVVPAKPGEGQTAEEFIKNPDQPAIYTLRTDYKVQRGEEYQVDYQPYTASVGAAATQTEKDKVNKTIDLPDIAGYDKLQDNFTINYDTIVKKSKAGTESKDANNGDRYNAKQEFDYKARSNSIKIKHVFQDLEDFTKYTNPDGSVGETGELITTQNGNTGSTMEVSPLTENDPRRKGFVPEADSITMQVPENAENFILEYRYNRAHYDVVYDTAGGTELPARTLYYGQAIPKIADDSIPKKVGGDFLGWKPSVELKTKDGKTFKANEIIAVGTGGAIKDLNANLIMPASNITFTAVWKDKEKADYAVQFWAEKADHSDGASLADKYDYIGTRVYKDKDTGMRPDLDNEPVKDIVFPDLDQARLNKIWAGKRFNRGKDPYLNKFYVYNQVLTHDQNKDPANVNLVKSVDATGKTVYNIYYDRQVYDLYFTKSNAQPAENTFYPEIWGYDKAKGESVMLGGPGKPYHYKARFNELMYEWPNDAKQTKGFTPGYQSFGWGPNYTTPNWPAYLDTPPYRLNADEFLDMANYTNWGGYANKIDKGDGTSIDLDRFDFKTLSFGIKQDKPSIPHHMDFWMDGFKNGETIIRYDLVRTKADTDSLTYGHKYPEVLGFTPYDYNPRAAWPVIEEGSQEDGRVTEDDIDDLNDKRDEITPNNCGSYYNNQGIRLPIGQLDFISVFFSDSDEFGDVKEGGQKFKENGYLQFKYTRNKYPLRFNYDPSIIRDDSYFNSKNQLDTFYQFPLKVLSPDLVPDGTERKDREYFKEDPKNFIDNPENLQKLDLTDLVFTDPKDGKLKVKRPDNLSDQMVFKGWALDPAGTKLIWENPKETMPTHPVHLFAKWGEPDYKWKVTFDPNGGSLRNIKEENLTTSRKKLQEGDIGQEEINTYAKKEESVGDKQIFTVIQRQKLVDPKKPTRKGYDFMGWEVIRYKKDANTGDYTNEIDTSYRDTYKVPELYSFGNYVVAPVYLKAIWVPNNRVDVKVEHHFLSLDLSKETKAPVKKTLADKRANYLVATTGDQQDDEYILATHEELTEKLTGDLKKLYEEYNERVNANNTYFQQFRVEPEKIVDPNDSSKMIDNPKVKENIFHFFYRPFRTRDYKVNYIDERFKGKADEKAGAIIGQEEVSNGNRHYDARNYRPIPGWVLAKDEKPQQQLFFDVDEETNAFKGINGTGKDEITFYYKDVRVIEVPENDPVPEGYVRVTFKADQGGSFTDNTGKSVTELNYDVIKGLKSDFLPVPKELAEGKEKEADKYYITPETGKKFIKWDKSPLLNKNTIISENHTFTAYFEWSGLSATGLVITEAFKDPENKWTNNFAPTIDQLKKQLVWKEKDVEKPLPAGTEIKLFDEKGNELTSNDQVYDLVNEKKAADKDELVRTVNVKAKVTFKDGKEPQELIIPITVYKNVYEALNKAGDKPLFLKEAEGKEAKDGGLKDVTGDYVMVTIKADKDFNAKDDKIYWVNKNAWVEIPEVKTEGSSTFVNWKADKDAQNENGVFDFTKRHKFTENTVISPSDAKDVVEQTDPNKKPDVPDSYVKVIVKTTDKATTETTFEKTFWVNPTKKVTIEVTNPTGKTVPADPTKVGAVGYTMKFSKWESTETTARVWEDKIVGQFTAETTIVAKYSVTPETIKPIVPKTDTVHTPQGKTPTVKEITKMITPPEGKTIKEVKIVENPDVNNPGESKVKVIVEYTDGSSVGTNDNPIEVPVKVHDSIVKANPDGSKPKDAMDNYVKVIFKAGTGGTVSGDLVYYVSPEVEVDMTKSAGKITKTPEVGYISGDWDTSETKKLKATFTADETEFTFNFTKTKDIVEKTDENTKKPDGYVTVKLIPTDKATDNKEKVYFVNPKKEVTIPDNTPTGKEVTDVNGNKYTYIFKGWTVTIGVIASWDKGSGDENPVIKSTFKQDTDITAKYNIKAENLVNGPIAKGNVVTQINEKPQAKDLIKNVYDSNDPNNKGNLPDGTKFEYEKEPDVSKAGDTTAKVKVTYPNNKTVVVEVPIKVVDNVIPQEGTEKPKVVPYNFVLVEYKQGTNGSLAGTTKYWVNPTAGKKLSDIVHPTVTATEGWKHTGWDKADTVAITEAIEVTAQYLEKVVTTNPNDMKNYVKVEFNEGEHGTIADDATKTYWVLKNETVTLTAPTVTAKEGYAQKTNEDAWSPKLATSYSNDTTHTAQYFYNGKDIIPQKSNDKPNNVPDDFVLVEFNQGAHGTIASTETTKYWVNPNVLVTLTPPKVKANSGYEQERGLGGWDNYLTGKFSEGTKITAQYRKIEVPTPPTPGDQDNPDKPNPGYPGGPGYPSYPDRPDYPSYPGRPIPMYPEVRYETIIKEKIVKVPVPVTDGYFKEVRYMQGFNGYFRPNDGLTRAEAAQILANALVEDGYKYNPNFKISYKDVGEAWYTRAVKIVTEAKVFTGYDDGNFKPQAKITRNEWIATLKRFQELGSASGNNMKLRDGHWAKAEIQAAFNEGWLKIYTDGLATYKGDEFIPRQEVAAVSNKAFKRIVDKTYIGKNNLSLVTYKDVNTSMWAYEDILCASNTFLDKKDRYIAHWVKEDKNQFNIDTSDFKIVQKNFQRNPR